MSIVSGLRIFGHLTNQIILSSYLLPLLLLETLTVHFSISHFVLFLHQELATIIPDHRPGNIAIPHDVEITLDNVLHAPHAPCRHTLAYILDGSVS